MSQYNAIIDRPFFADVAVNVEDVAVDVATVECSIQENARQDDKDPRTEPESV